MFNNNLSAGPYSPVLTPLYFSICVIYGVFMVLQDCLSPLSMQALPAAPESLCVVEMGGHDVTREDVEGGSQSGLFLNIGLQVEHLLFYSRYWILLCCFLSICVMKLPSVQSSILWAGPNASKLKGCGRKDIRHKIWVLNVVFSCCHLCGCCKPAGSHTVARVGEFRQPIRIH